MENLAEEILDDREKRVNLQEELLKKYKMPLLSIRVNYPGIHKDNQLTADIIREIDSVASRNFKSNLYYKLFRITSEGPIITMLIDDEVSNIKHRAISIEENHSLGRCVDIDVYDENGRGVSRQDLGIKPRKCFICHKEARFCVREKSHNFDEVISFISTTYREFKSNKNGYK